MDRRGVPDWRSADAYAALARCGRHAFAWEWLRRAPAYRAAWETAAEGGRGDPAAFGLHRFEPPCLPIPDARPIWTADADPHVLPATVAPAAGDELFDARRFAAIAELHVGDDGREHWLFSDGYRNIRLDLSGGTLRAGPAPLAFHIAVLAGGPPRVPALLRLIALARTGQLDPALLPPERRAPRWALVLRAHDALSAGASHREIAAELFGLGHLPRWRIEAPSYRRRVQRLAALAQGAARTDPRRWLDGSYP